MNETALAIMAGCGILLTLIGLADKWDGAIVGGCVLIAAAFICKVLTERR